MRMYRARLTLTTALVCLTHALSGQSVYPTGTTRYDPAKALNSFVLFTGGDSIARLIDMNGTTVHEWRNAGDLTTLIDPRLTGGKLGHVLVTLSMVDIPGTDLVPGVTGRAAQSIGELDWEGNTVWTFGAKAPDKLAYQHHDWDRLPNGNTLVLANTVHPIKGFTQPRLLDDVIYEVNPAGDVVWTWTAGDHLEEFGFTAEQLPLIRNSDSADYLHVNSMRLVGRNHWFTAGDERFRPDNVIISSRNANVVAIIDRKTGKVVWTLGPNYASAPPSDRRVPRPLDR
ncbi:MAG TPA: aryl-sulfate sulfotransferase, partial [Vicinamibacterales bacterium]|nr:aryl-sulfate sulfotransferase [Vicinamibacterales bacterium]